MRKITDKENNNLLKILTIGNYYASVGEFDSATYYLGGGIDFAQSQPMNYADDNFIARKDSLYRLSIDSYDKIIESNPNAYNYQNRGIYKKDSGLHREALNDFNASIKLDGSRGLTYYNRALAYRKLDLLDSAAIDYKNCIKFDPNYLNAHLNLGYVYINQGEYDDAIDEFIIITELESGVKTRSFALNNIGYAYYKLGQFTKAEKYVNESIALNSINSYAYRNRGIDKN